LNRGWPAEEVFEICPHEHQYHKYFEYNDKKMTIKAWCKELQLKYTTIMMRIKSGWTIEEALELIPRKKRRKTIMKKIYIITTLRRKYEVMTHGPHKGKRKLILKQSRAIGWYDNLDDAEDAVLDNDTISEDGYYGWAVIEKATPGIYPIIEKEWWYKWNSETKRYFFNKKPVELKLVVGFGIG